MDIEHGGVAVVVYGLLAFGCLSGGDCFYAGAGESVGFEPFFKFRPCFSVLCFQSAYIQSYMRKITRKFCKKFRVTKLRVYRGVENLFENENKCPGCPASPLTGTDRTPGT